MSREHLSSVRARLRAEASQRGIDPRDLDLLLADSVGRPVSFVLAHGELEIDPEAIAASLKRRFAGEPLQYIRQRTDFYGREFYVDDRVLIPRPETELLVEAVLKLATRGARVIDVGCGSGAIAISIERERRDLRVVAVDVSPGAMAVTARNRDRLAARVRLAASDVLAAIDGEFDLIASNPPYIPSGQVPGLQVEVRDHEPHRALTPGATGTEIIDRLLEESCSRLASGGRIVLEIGFGQKALVSDLAKSHGYGVESVIPDLAGIPRTVVLSRHVE
jgi:release factor glutamine methyltransferase